MNDFEKETYDLEECCGTCERYNGWEGNAR